jgi:putative phosphoesterase
MVIGILSDNHGRIEPVQQAIEIFRDHGAEAAFHCGDIGGLETLHELANAMKRCYFVWGNTDQPYRDWIAPVKAMGMRWPEGPLLVELAGKRIALAHGHEWQAAAMHTDATIHYLLTGHSHCRRDERVGTIRCINPGALHRAHPKTVATLDLATDELIFHEVQ